MNNALNHRVIELFYALKGCVQAQPFSAFSNRFSANRMRSAGRLRYCVQLRFKTKEGDLIDCSGANFNLHSI